MVTAKLLLGWMSRDEAVNYLRDQCLFDKRMTDAELEATWTAYKDRVSALPARNPKTPEPVKQLISEKLFANKILKRAKKDPTAKHIKRVLKLDPRWLTVHQLLVVLESARNYELKMDSTQSKAKTCLGFGFPTATWTETRNGDNLAIDLPHGEFNLGYNPNTKQFVIQENAKWVSVYRYDSRMLLWAGYHRAYAVLSSQTYPEDTERLLLAVETTEAERLLGFNSDRPERRDILLSERPPLFADFFDDDLCMIVKLRKGHWRFDVHVPTLKATKAWIHDAS